jgi:hypothetical protein
MLSNKLQKKRKNERIMKRFKRLTLSFIVILGYQVFLSSSVEDISNTFFAQADGM